MVGPTSIRSRALPALLAAVVVSIVVGIVGMHALNTHGVLGSTDHATMTSPMTSPMTSLMTGAHADTSSGMSAGPETGSPADVVPAGDNGPSMGSMVMLCFAMLAAAAGALLFLGLLRTPRDRAHRPSSASTVVRWITARLGTGPPYVWEFSVIRC